VVPAYAGPANVNVMPATTEADSSTDRNALIEWRMFLIGQHLPKWADSVRER